MRARGRTARIARGLAAAAALAGLVSLAACGRPPDEAWLRIVSFEDGAGTPLATLESWLQEEASTESVRVRLENRTSTTGLTGGGIGILVRGMRVETFASGRALPVQELPVTLYLPPGDASAEAAAGGATLEVGVVTPTLKRWIQDHLVVPEEGLSGSARVTVFAVTDEGRELETAGGLGLRIVDAPKPSSN